MTFSDNIKNLRKEFPAGTKIKLIKMDDIHAPAAGTIGTVENVDDIGTIHVVWENGQRLGLIPEVDVFVKI